MTEVATTPAAPSEAGRLRVGLVEVGLPSVGVPNPNWIGPTYLWRGGGRGTKAIPKGTPAPFDCFKVTATAASLSAWWAMSEATGRRRHEPATDSAQLAHRRPRRPAGDSQSTIRFAAAPHRPA